MSIYTAPLQDLVREFVESGEAFQPGEIAERFIADHGDLVRTEAQRLQHNGIVREIKTYLKSLTDDDEAAEQMSLPGMHLPSVIAIPAETVGGFIYRNTMDCRLVDLRAGRHVRAKNVDAAVEKLDRYDDAVRILEPEMSLDPSMTVREAVDRMVGRHEAA